MLFGRGGKAEEIEFGQLEDLLNSSFDQKLKNFDAKNSSTIKELPRARLQFSEACRGFEELNVEPEIENYYINNANFIKTQKNFYSNALKRIVNDWDATTIEAPNVYSKYNLVLSNTEKFVNETLKTNNSFRQVLHSYAKYLDSFKKSFAFIERLRDSLKTGLDRMDRELSEYNILTDRIRKLVLLKEELELVNKTINEFSSGGSPYQGDTASETEILKSIGQKESELSNLNATNSNLHNKISAITVPLERPSRKLDHIATRKRQLYQFIADPINNLNDESDYKEFIVLVEELKKSVDSGVIDTKNNSKIAETISELLTTDLYSMIMTYKSHQKKESDLRAEIRVSRSILNKIKEDRYNSEKMIKDAELLKKRAIEIAKDTEIAKSTISKLFLEYYKKGISIIGI